MDGWLVGWLVGWVGRKKVLTTWGEKEGEEGGEEGGTLTDTFNDDSHLHKLLMDVYNASVSVSVSVSVSGWNVSSAFGRTIMFCQVLFTCDMYVVCQVSYAIC